MSKKIQLYNRHSIDDFVKNAKLSKEKKNFLQNCMLENLSTYISNSSDSEFSVLETRENIVPLIINKDILWDKCYLLSPYAHYINYTNEELNYFNRVVVRDILRLLLILTGFIARLCSFNKVVYINNWLFSTNFDFKPKQETLQDIVEALVDRYQDRVLVIRSVNSLDKKRLDLLKSLNFTLVINRQVHYWDPNKYMKIHKKKRRTVKKDMGLLEKYGCSLSCLNNPQETDFEKISELYIGLYCEKHSTLNPEFTPNFFQMLYQTGILRFKVIKEGETIVGFFSYFIEENMFYPLMIGYDLHNNLPIYRMIFGAFFKHSLDNNCMLFLSSGVGSFKKNRGTFQRFEYEAVYYKHVPFFRKIPWILIKKGFDMNARMVYTNSTI